jgi:glyoxylase-like metal-dependent hydrolase (beta-lactamase superfamily II)
MPQPWFTTTQVHPQIYALAEFSHWEKVISYLLIDQERAFLIDTGMGYESIRSAVDKITNLPLSVLLTHAHWDHIGGVAEFNDVSISNHPFEVNSLEKGFSSSDIPELTDQTLFSDGFLPKEYTAAGQRTPAVLTDGQQIQSYSFTVQVIHTPGHTPGSVCFFVPQLNALFTGDTLYEGPLYAQLPESNLTEYSNSIAKLQQFVNQEVLVFGGHNSVQNNESLITDAKNVFDKLAVDPSLTEIKGTQLSLLI